MPGSTHPALFCIHLLSSAGCRLPGVLAAQPAPLGPGGQLLQAGGGRDDVPFTWQSLGNGSAAAGLEHWRCECVQVERTARDCSGRHPGGSCWKEAGGCRGAVATAAPPHAVAVGTLQGAEQEYILQLSVSPAAMQTSLRAVPAVSSVCSSRLALGGQLSPHGAPKNSRQHTPALGSEPCV